MSVACPFSGECLERCEPGSCRLEDHDLWNTGTDGDHRLVWTVLGEPRSKKRGRIVGGPRPRLIKHPDTERAEQVFALLSNSKLPAEPYAGPVEVGLRFVFEVPANWPKWKQQAAIEGRWLHVSKPDVDNLVKLALDALNGLAWIDDTQVVAVRPVKCYGETPRTDVEVRLLKQATA